MPREFRTKPRECNPVLSARRPSGGHPIQRTLPFHREVANVDQPVLCARLDGGRIDGELKLAADHLGVSVGETEECAGVVGVEINQVPALARPRISPISGVSRPSLPLNAKFLITPLRRDSLQSKLRNASPK